MGGEKSTKASLPAGPSGSPPHGRGKEEGTLQALANMGITPAWAGKSCWCFCRSAGGWDHPRVGGEKIHVYGVHGCLLGSPPRGRGKGPPGSGSGKQRGITPAWAGKSAALPSAPSGPRDHPRVGGEKNSLLWALSRIQGSPPRGRGKATSSSSWEKQTRITPAWAGKRITERRLKKMVTDHPRVGGEKWHLLLCVPAGYGSPPRGRGKASTHSTIASWTGITPAWAGKSDTNVVYVPATEDHPRVGGEKFRTVKRSCILQGSPPRGRGKVCIATGLRVSDGITPAWAGKSLTIPKLTTRSWDHPRVGREKDVVELRKTPHRGSPPRGRGKVYLGPQLWAGNGITPAWAGKSASQPFGYSAPADHPRVGGEKLKICEKQD